MAVATAGIAVAHTGLIPTRISALGIDFGATDQRAFVLILALIISYLVIAFAIYAAVDFLAWRSAHDEALLAHLMTEHAVVPLEELPYDPPWQRVQKQIHRRRWRWGTWSRKISGLRASWEFGLPVVVGIYAIGALLWAIRGVI